MLGPSVWSYFPLLRILVLLGLGSLHALKVQNGSVTMAVTKPASRPIEWCCVQTIIIRLAYYARVCKSIAAVAAELVTRCETVLLCLPGASIITADLDT